MALQEAAAAWHFEKPYKEAEKYMDRLFESIPYTDDFEINNVINNSAFSKEDKSKAHQLYSEIYQLLVTKLKYAEEHDDSNYYLFLTDKGNQVKQAGGHFAYINKVSERSKADFERQRLNDEKLKFDLKNSKRIFKTYWWTFWFSVIGLGVSLTLAIMKIIEVVNTK